MKTLGPSISSSLVHTAPTSKHSPFATKAQNPIPSYFTEKLHPIGWKSKIEDRDCSDSGCFGGDKSNWSRGHLANSCGCRCDRDASFVCAAGVTLTPFVVAGKRIVRLSYFDYVGRWHTEDVRCVEDQGWFIETRTIFDAPDVVGFSRGSCGKEVDHPLNLS
ncbi:hypothetical protein CJ030_MR0G027282 [Morella rubra]|uniref:Uncharacterized protein n=1 Tax=Morella rubra TaxID=262757 RepID=A0A6A1UED1_9ROSI|nr:hypothetical protein CJ030_MR0G027282 [Morella rubra]